MSGGGRNAASQPEEKNPVLQLNDIRKDCVYEVMEGDDTPERRFVFKLTIDGKTFEGAGSNKKAAKANAARKALMHPAVNANANAYKNQHQKKNQNQRKPENSNKQNTMGQNKKPQQNSGFMGMPHGKNSNSLKGYTMMNSPMANSNDLYINGRKVCPYYLNSLCVRGKQCQFYHPAYSPRLESSISADPQTYPRRIETPLSTGSQQVPLEDTFTWLQFCQNYLHLRCPRSDCKFLHVSIDDEDVYRATGRIPAHLVEQAVRKAMVDDIAPAGVTQPCKAYLEGQCNWYSCPFRHISRQDFSREVVNLLHQEFEGKMRPKSGYRLIANRILDRDSHLYDSRKPFDRRDYPFEKDNVRGSLSRGDDYLVHGMKSLSLDRNLSDKQREVEDLRSQLNMLHEENERLRSSMRVRSEDEKRLELLHEERRIQEKLEKLKVENESLRGYRGSSYPVSSQHTLSNAGYGSNFYADMRNEMKRQNPESYNFDELLNTGLMNRGQGFAHQLIGMPLNTAKKSQALEKMTGKGKQKNIIPKLPVKKSGQIIQTAARPSYQIKVYGGKKVYLPVNQKKNKPPQNQPAGNNPNKQANQKKAPNPAGPKSVNNKNETKRKEKAEKKKTNNGNGNKSHPSNGSPSGAASERLLNEDGNDVIIEETIVEETIVEETTEEDLANSQDNASSQDNAGSNENAGSKENAGSQEKDSDLEGCDKAKESEVSAGVSGSTGEGDAKVDEDKPGKSKAGEKRKAGEQGNTREKSEGKQNESDRWVDAAEDNF